MIAGAGLYRYTKWRNFLTTLGFVLAISAVVVIAITTLRPAHAMSTDDFVTTWKTDNPGITNSSSVQLRFIGIGGPYDIDWNNDGIFDDTNTYGGTHDYGTPGTYTIRVRSHGSIHLSTQFSDADKLISVDQWGTAPWSSMADAFHNASNMVVNATDTPDLSQATDMSNAFDGATSFNSSNIGSWDVSHITRMYYTFNGATSFNQDISGWDVSNVTDMTQLFANTRSFNQPLSSWNTSKVTDMTALFGDATAFNQDISTWDTSNVISMAGMFGGATSFNQNISSWKTSKLLDMQGMFANATSFNQPLNNWNVSLISYMANVFRNATSFNQDISSWDVSHVSNMVGMFNGATSFNQPLSNWNVSQVTDMSSMFQNATSFNQDISHWNTSNVVGMDYMFNGARSFNQPVGSLDVSSAKYMGGMLDGTAYGTREYDATIRGWSTQSLQHNIVIGLSYCTAGTERAFIMNTYGWNIYGAELCNSHFVSSGGWTAANIAAKNAVQDGIVDTFTTYGLTLDATTPYSLNCAQPTPDSAYFKIGGTSGDELHFKTALSYNAPQDVNHDNTYEVCVRALSTDGQALDTVFTVTILPPQLITGATFSVDASNRKVLTVSGQSFFGPDESIGNAFTTSLVRLNGTDLKFCSDGFGMTAQDFIDAYDSEFPNIANLVADGAPCYWLVGDNGMMTDTHVAIWLPDMFNTSARGTVSVNGSAAYIFNPDAAGDIPPTADVNGATKPLDQHPTIAPLPTFSGVANPGATVTVTVHSDPVTCTTTADANGNWSCTLPTSLPAGEHTVYVKVVNPDSSVENLGPYAVTVAAGAGGTVTNTTPKAPNTGVLEMVQQYKEKKATARRDAVVASTGVGVAVTALGVGIFFGVMKFGKRRAVKSVL